MLIMILKEVIIEKNVVKAEVEGIGNLNPKFVKEMAALQMYAISIQAI